MNGEDIPKSEVDALDAALTSLLEAIATESVPPRVAALAQSLELALRHRAATALQKVEG